MSWRTEKKKLETYMRTMAQTSDAISQVLAKENG